MTTDYPEPAAHRAGPRPSVEELFAAAPPMRSADDLARDGIFDDGEVEEFLTDLHAMRTEHG